MEYKISLDKSLQNLLQRIIPCSQQTAQSNIEIHIFAIW